MKKSLIFFSLLIVLLLSMSSANAGNYWTYEHETFEDDTAGGDPSSSWYTFTDSAWGDYTAINETFFRTGNHSYEIDDADGVGDFTWFNWTGESYGFYELYFMIGNFTLDEINFYIGHTVGIGNEVKILGNNDHVEPYLIYSNYTTEGWNKTISNNTWWRLRWDFNYTTNMVQCRLYNNASAEQTSANTTWLLADPEAGALNIADITGIGMLGASGKGVRIWFDDMQIGLYHTTSRLRDNPNFDAQQIILFGVLLIVMMLAVLMFILDMIKEQKLSIEKLVGLVFIIVIMAVVMTFI